MRQLRIAVGRESRGSDTGKKINGRKRFIVTDTCRSVTASALPRTQYQRLPVPQHHKGAVAYLLTGRPPAH
ncbi:hypothetical protein GCM10022420_098650 [Streptomyces iranensis]